MNVRKGQSTSIRRSLFGHPLGLVTGLLLGIALSALLSAWSSGVSASEVGFAPFQAQWYPAEVGVTWGGPSGNDRILRIRCAVAPQDQRACDAEIVEQFGRICTARGTFVRFLEPAHGELQVACGPQ